MVGYNEYKKLYPSPKSESCSELPSVCVQMYILFKDA